jgi:hypothetical protein
MLLAVVPLVHMLLPLLHPGLEGALLWNRLLWLAIAFAVLGVRTRVSTTNIYITTCGRMV